MHAVAARHATHESAVNVGERNGQSVVLHFATHLKGFAIESAAHAVVPCSHILLIIGIGKREHGILVRHLRKLLIQVAAHALCRRVGIVQFWVTGFKLLKFVHKPVELHIGDFRLVEHIILVIVLMQHLAQIYDTFFFVHYIVFYLF